MFGCAGAGAVLRAVALGPGIGTPGRPVQYSTPVLGPAIDRAVRAGSVPAGTGDGIDGADVATTTGEGEDEGVEAGSCTGKTDGAAVAAAAVSSVARSTTVDAAGIG